MKILDTIGLTELINIIKNNFAKLNSPALTGTPTAPTPAANDDSTKIATTAFVQDAIDGMEPVNGISDSDIASAWGNVTPASNIPSGNSDSGSSSGSSGPVSWNDILNKPTFATVATSGDYDDLSDKPSFATETYVDTAVSDLVNSAPATLDTLNELATALGNDPNFATTVATNIGSKVSADSANYIKAAAINNNVLTLTKGDDTTVVVNLAYLSTSGGTINGNLTLGNNGHIILPSGVELY